MAGIERERRRFVAYRQVDKTCHARPTIQAVSQSVNSTPLNTIRNVGSIGKRINSDSDSTSKLIKRKRQDNHIATIEMHQRHSIPTYIQYTRHCIYSYIQLVNFLKIIITKPHRYGSSYLSY